MATSSSWRARTATVVAVLAALAFVVVPIPLDAQQPDPPGVESDDASAGDLFVPLADAGLLARHDPASGARVSDLVADPDQRSSPYAAVVGPDGLVYASDAGTGRIDRFDPRDGTHVDTFISTPAERDGEPPFVPRGFAFDSAGDLFVVDAGAGVLHHFQGGTGDPVGTAIGGGVLVDPAAVVMAPDGTLLVSDQGDDDVERFDPETGDHLGTFTMLRAGTSPAGMTWGPDGNLFVALGGTGEVTEIDASSGETLDLVITGLGGPSGLAFDADGSLWVSDYWSDTVTSYDLSTGDPTGSTLDIEAPAGPRLLASWPPSPRPEPEPRPTPSPEPESERQAAVLSGEDWLDTLSPSGRGLPLAFAPNVGHADAAFDFAARGRSYDVLLGNGAAVLRPRDATLAASLGLRLAGAAETPTGRPTSRAPNGDTAAVTYSDILPGIAVRYSAAGPNLEYSFEIKPGADPDDIELEFSGASAVALEPAGSLLLTLEAGGRIRSTPPITYQVIGGEQTIVDSGYRLLGDGSVGFRVGSYDRGLPLVIDPVLVSIDEIWFTTRTNVPSPSGAPGLDSWLAAEALAFGDPSFVLEPGPTDGTLSSVFDLSGHVSGGVAELDGLHYVTSTITVGTANAVNLEPGDLLFSTENNETFTVAGFTANDEDIVLFEPTTPGDYSSGTFSLLYDMGTFSADDTRALTLAEKTTTVGDASVPAGTLFIGRESRRDIIRFDLTDVGPGTAGTESEFADGPTMGFGSELWGLELLEDEVSIGGITVPAGRFLATVNNDGDTVGSSGQPQVAVNGEDIFSLDITTTGTSPVAGAYAFFDGSDVALNTSAEDVVGLTLTLPTPADLLGRWRFDEGSGTTALDSSGAGHDGTITGATYTAGVSSTALDFTGTAGERVVVGDPVDGSLDPGTGDLSISAWFRTTALPGSGEFDQLVFKSDGSEGYELFLADGGGTTRLTFRVRDGGSSWTALTVTPLDDGAWHHAAGVMDGSNLRLYVDGTLVDTQPHAATDVDTTELLAFGADSAGPAWSDFEGDLDEIAIYGRAVSAAEVSALATPAGDPVVLDGIQKGTATLGPGFASTTATITAVDATKSFLTFSLRASDSNPENLAVTGELTNATTVTFQRPGTTGTVTIEWSVVEFASGVTVQRGTTNISATTTNVAISAVDLTRSFPIISDRAPGTAFGDNDFVRAELTSTTNLRLSMTNTNTNVVKWQVVTYNDASVQSGTVSFGTGDASRTATISAVDPAKTWLMYSLSSDNGTGSNIGQKLVRGRVTNGTTLTFDRSNTGQAMNVSWFAVEFTDATEVQHASQVFASAEATHDVTITAVDPTRSIAVGGYKQYGGRSAYSSDDNPGVGWFTTRLTSSTNLRIQRNAALATADLGWFVIEWPGCGDTDGDGLLDCEEDANTDADDDPATNPGPDTDGDAFPNYLDADDDDDGTPTSSENADPNGDGDPRDALDTDRDGQPDYLDLPTTASDGTVGSEQKISSTSGGLTAALDDDDRFGRATTSLGDLDGDGIVDLAVGAFLDDDGGDARGAVHVLFMNANGTVKAEQKISDTAGGLIATLDDVDYFGLALSGLGDIDGDGLGDLAVGAYRDDDGGANRGAVHILFMNANGTVKAEQKISDTAGGLTAPLADNDWFGVAVAGVGDLDDDGINDVAVGAADDDGGTDRGAVYVLFLNANGTVRAEQKISDTAGGFAATLDDSDMFGEAIAAVGDLDGDMIEDIVVGANGDDDGGADHGAAHVLFLNANGTVKGEQKISSTSGGLTATLDSGDRFGAAVAGIGDVDGDSVLDVAVGAHLDDDGGSARGAVHILFLNANGTVKAEQKISDSTGGFTGPLDDLDFFGHGLAGVGDLDGDGLIDLAVGAHTDDDGGSGRGAVYVLDLAAVTTTTVTFQEGVDGYSGTIDTWVSDAVPTQDNSAASSIDTDSSPIEQGLIRFDGIIGSGPGQIPPGATITSATLTLVNDNPAGSGANLSLYRMLTSWAETDTWNILGSGVQTNGVEASSTADVVYSGAELTVIDSVSTISGLEATVQAWVDGTANNGWLFELGGTTDGLDLRSSENATVAWRPLLSVTYTTGPGPTFVVNSTGDAGDTGSDGVCDTGALNSEGAPECTLRAAIEEANRLADHNDVSFAIPQTDPGYAASPEVFTIQPGSVYDDIVHPVTIDGATQAEYGPNPVIELDGQLATGATAGLVLETDDSTINGLIVHSFDDEGLEIDASTGGGQRNTLSNNWVGVDAAQAARPNLDIGVLVTVGAADNTITGNVISSNTNSGLVIRNAGSDGNTVQGNIIGLAPNGATPRPNGSHGIEIYDAADGNLIGGPNLAEGNVIVGNAGDGVRIAASSGSANSILRNEIRANGDEGIDLSGAGVTPNSNVDAWLDYPYIVAATESGGTVTVDFDLDLPAGTYRIEAFTNPSGADTSGYGEGEQYETSQTIGHTGSGSESFQLTYTGSAGDVVTLTTTEDLGAGSYGATSEFSSAATAGAGRVNSTGDAADATPGDHICDTGGIDSDGNPECTLRAAIEEANASTRVDAIHFLIPTTDTGHAAGIWTISPATALPPLSAQVVVDATTQTGYATPVVRVDGNSTTGASGFTITATADSTELIGMMITRFDLDGVFVASGADSVTVADNWIGSNNTGAASLGNGDDGIDLNGASATIDGNVINNNGDEGIDVLGAGATITGNIVGLEADGTTGLGNVDVGIALFAESATIGGDTAAERNVVSMNWEGIEVNTSNNTIQGNYIGTDVTGVFDRGNRIGDGIEIQAGTGNLVGGTVPAEGNRIAFNQLEGVDITGGTAAVFYNTIHSNGRLGINLAGGVEDGFGVTDNDAGDGDIGPNDLLNHPVTTSATTSGIIVILSGTFDVPAGDYRFDIYKNPSGADGSGFGEGEQWVGTSTLSHSGAGSQGWGAAFVGAVGDEITVTVTESLGGGNFGATSEFSEAVTVKDPFAVNSTGDAGDATPGDFVCDTGGTNSEANPECTLRAALEEANALAGPDTIEFAMPATEAGHSSGVWTIAPGSELPQITGATTLDATTQTGYVTTPVVELNGSGAPVATDGFRIFSPDVEIRGFAVNRFGADGIEVDTTSTGGVVIAANHIGLDATGLIDRGNGGRGIDLQVGSGPTTVGGTNTADRNVISGNGGDGILIFGSDANTIINNFIGTDVTGNASGAGIGNGADGIALGSTSAGNIIGQPGVGNVVSGNDNDGVENDATGPDNTLQANTIGLGADGSTVVGNSRYGVVIYNGANTTQIGGPGAGEGNVISGNVSSGIIMDGAGNPATAGNVVAGNIIGLDTGGTLDRGNGAHGVHLFAGASANTIGGATAAHGNVIAGNGSGSHGGVYITGGSTSANVVRNNFVGTNAAGDAAVMNNLHGVWISNAPDTDVLDNLISGNNVHGVYIFGSSTTGTEILRNRIGADAAITTPLPNGFDGVRLEGGSTGTIIGSPLNGNTIAGNGQRGVNINDNDANVVQANWIGTDPATGTVDLGNTLAGVHTDAFGSSNNTIGGVGLGEGNTIAFNGEGVTLVSGTGNSILGNDIYSNDDLGIDLEDDGITANSNMDSWVNYPVMTSAVAAAGTITVDFDLDLPAGDYRVELFMNPGGADPSGNGEGEAYVDFADVISHPGGSASYSTTTPGSAGDVLTATATEVLAGPTYGATSEFSPAATVTGGFDITGTVFEDVVGDVLDDGTIGDANNPGVSGVDVYLYLDDGDSNLDAGDTLVGGAPVQTDGSGVYSFAGLVNGDYFVIVDSKTVTASAPALGPGNTWAEQTYGPIGGYCDNGIGFQIRVAAGPCYGGISDSVSDDFSQWDDHEHRAFLSVSGSDVTAVDFGFSYNVVTTMNGGDTRDDDPGNGRTVQGSVRQFIQNANAISGANSMRLVPPSSAGAGGVWTLPVSNTLPAISGGATTLDGTVYAFADGISALDTNAAGPELVIDGSGATASDGITVNAANNTIRDLVIGGFADSFEAGILLQGATADNNVISGVYIGTDATATAPNPNYYGIRMNGGAGSNIIGGIISADRNVISGNSEDGVSISGAATDLNIVRGNYIGTNATGTASLGNGDGIDISSGALNTIIGGASPPERNVISGNSGQGIFVTSDSTNIWGNYIGTSATGDAAVGNLRGVWISGGDGNLVGGASPVLGNLISGNTFRGVLVANAATNNAVSGNLIGTDAAGTGSIPNLGPGVEINFSATDNVIGGTAPDAGNVIANNTGDGVSVAAAGSTRNSVLGNVISANGRLGIDLVGGASEAVSGVTRNDAGDGDSGPNDLLNAPVLVGAERRWGRTTVTVWLDVPAGAYRLEFFDNAGADPSGFGEGETLLETLSVTHAGGGAETFVMALPLATSVVTATVTEDLGGGSWGSTSEFSNALSPVDAFELRDSSQRRSDVGGRGVDASNEVTGIAGTALRFDGTGERLVGPALDLTDSALTIAAWVNATSLSGTPTIISKRDGAGNAVYELAVDAGSGEAVVTLRLGGSGVTAQGGSVGTGAWHHLAATWDGVEVALYVDGVEVDRVAAVGPLATAVGTALIIGNTANAVAGFDGDIDHVVVSHEATGVERLLAQQVTMADQALAVSVGAQQSSTPGAWTVSGVETRSGAFALSAPETSGPDAAAWAVATGIDEPGTVFESWWWLSDDTTVDVAGGTRAGTAPTDQYEAALTSPSGWELRRRVGATEATDAPAAGTSQIGQWVKVEIWTDQFGDTRVFIDGVEAIGWTSQGASLSSGSVALRAGLLPTGEVWYVDDARARKLVTPEPVTSLAALDRN